MIIMHDGVPGSGKTYDTVRKIIYALKVGRTVYTNIDGLDDPLCLEHLSSQAGLTRDQLNQQLIFMTNDQVLCFWTFAEKGSLIVIDEVQKYFNSKNWSSQDNKDFSAWADEHRHDGFDLIMMTPNLKKVDSGVRSTMQIRYRYRKVNFFGDLVTKRYLVYTYEGEDTKPLTNKPQSRTYDTAIFRCYKSYKGDATEKQFQKNPNVLNHPLVYFAGLMIIVTGYMFTKSSFATGDPFGYSKLSKKPEVRADVGLSHTGLTSGSSTPTAKPVQGSPVPQKAKVETPAGDKINLFPVSAYIEQKGKIYLQVYGVLLYQYDNFDKSNMVVGISQDHMPAALTLKIAQIEKNKARSELVNQGQDLPSDSPGKLVPVDQVSL